MLTPAELLKEGEELLGSYNVEIARWQSDRWVSTVPTLYIVLTDHRMILQPHTRKRYEPAIIPARYITQVTELEAPYRHGVLMRLATGHQIGMFISGRFNREVLRNLHRMMRPIKPMQFNPQLDIQQLQKLIDFFNSA